MDFVGEFKCLDGSAWNLYSANEGNKSHIVPRVDGRRVAKVDEHVDFLKIESFSCHLQRDLWMFICGVHRDVSLH